MHDDPDETLLRAMPALAAGLGAGACGYALAGRGSFLPDYIKTLGIPMFGNTTPYQSIEQVFTQKVREEFQSRGALHGRAVRGRRRRDRARRDHGHLAAAGAA